MLRIYDLDSNYLIQVVNGLQEGNLDCHRPRLRSRHPIRDKSTQT